MPAGSICGSRVRYAGYERCLTCAVPGYHSQCWSVTTSTIVKRRWHVLRMLSGAIPSTWALAFSFSCRRMTTWTLATTTMRHHNVTTKRRPHGTDSSLQTSTRTTRSDRRASTNLHKSNVRCQFKLCIGYWTCNNNKWPKCSCSYQTPSPDHTCAKMTSLTMQWRNWKWHN